MITTMNIKNLKFNLLLLVVIPTLLFSQQLTQVTIYGVVTDSLTAQPLEGVLVEAINEADTSERASALTASDGSYTFNMVTGLKSTQDEDQLPNEFRLLQNYPNPFNPSTTIRFQIPQNSQVKLVIYNTLGQKIRTLLDQPLARDIYTVEWDGTNDAGNGVAAGIYFYQLRTSKYMETRKMLLLDGHTNNPSFSSSYPKKSTMVNVKDNSLLITIEASAPNIQFYKKEHIQVTSPIMQYSFSVQKLPDLINMSNITVSELIEKQSVYIGGKPRSIKTSMDRLEKVQVTNHQLNLSTTANLNYDKSFPPMQMRAQEGDKLSVTVLCEGQPASSPVELKIPDINKPEVLFSKPTNGDKDIIVDVVISVHFSEPILTSSVNINSFYLLDSLSNVVPGSISLLSDTVALLTPNLPLEYYSDYTIIVTTEVQDLQDLHMENPYSATFKTKHRQILFNKYYGNPIMSSDEFPAWDAGYVARPTVIFDGIQYQMFYNGYNSLAFNWAVGYATSTDGIVWDKDTLNNPVLVHGSPGTWDSEDVLVSSVVFDGSIYHMWYTGVDSGAVNWKIGYAWSSNGIDWDKYDDTLTTSLIYSESDPVLDIGPPGSWDDNTVKYPHVILEEDTFKMWYSALPGIIDQSIGYATSLDGIHWKKDTVNNPVLEPGTELCWDNPWVDDPCVVFDGNIYHMFYAGGWMYTHHQIGYAWSDNGIDWSKYDIPTTTDWPFAISDPVLRTGPYGSWEYFWVGDPWVIMDDQTGLLKMWYTGYFNHRHIGYATGFMDPINLRSENKKK